MIGQARNLYQYSEGIISPPGGRVQGEDSEGAAGARAAVWAHAGGAAAARAHAARRHAARRVGAAAVSTPPPRATALLQMMMENIIWTPVNVLISREGKPVTLETLTIVKCGHVPLTSPFQVRYLQRAEWIAILYLWIKTWALFFSIYISRLARFKTIDSLQSTDPAPARRDAHAA